MGTHEITAKSATPQCDDVGVKRSFDPGIM